MATLEEVTLRQSTIIAVTQEQGRCSVGDLAERFLVTPETIRRDLKVLEQQGVLRRVHGGAVLNNSSHNTDLLAVDEDDVLPVHQSQRRKQSIAIAALDYIPGPNSAIFIDAGSTTEAFANVLARSYVGQSWIVVTNSPNVARTLASAGVREVHMLGGTVKARTQAVIGDATLALLRTLKADVAFMGTSGLSPQCGCTTSDPREAAVKTAMIQRASKTIVLCDSTKMLRDSEVSFADLDSINTIITDRNVSSTAVNAFAPYQTEIVIP